MKKVLVLVGLLLVVGFAEISAVRELKAYDNSFSKQQVQNDVWQNRSEKVRFEWKEPYATVDVKGYRYYFGKEQAGGLTQQTSNTFLVTDTLSSDGIYYLRLAAVGADDTQSPIRTFRVKYDRTPIANDLAAAVYTDSSQSVVVPNGAQELAARPFIKFDITKLKALDAQFKGVDIYFGPDQNGKPDRQIKNEFQVRANLAASKNYYLIAAVEDEAGNVSQTKILATLLYTKPAIALNGVPMMVVLGRTIKVDNPNPENKEQLIPGSVVKYAILLNNQGASDAYGVEIKDVIPDGTTYVKDSANSNKPALVEVFDQSLNGGKGLWTAVLPANLINVKKVRWIFDTPFNPAVGKAPQATVQYSVIVNQI